MARLTRPQLLACLAQVLHSIDRPHPVRVAVDGIDAAGKTTLADELAGRLRRDGRHVIRTSVDDFQHPRAVRYQRGRASPAGYYHDAFDDDALVTDLLRPLGPGGSRRYRPAVFDYRADAPLTTPALPAPAGAILLLDGVFLLRPELRRYWEFSIFLDVDFDVALQRAVARDRALFGSAAAVRERYGQRYFPAQRRYLKEHRPAARADAVVDNNDPETPVLVRMPSGPCEGDTPPPTG